MRKYLIRAYNYKHYANKKKAAYIMEAVVEGLLSKKIDMLVSAQLPWKARTTDLNGAYFESLQTLTNIPHFYLSSTYYDINTDSKKIPFNERTDSFTLYAHGTVNIIGKREGLLFDLKMKAKNGSICEYEEEESIGPFYENDSLLYKYIAKESYTGQAYAEEWEKFLRNGKL